jgi:hypothetical protein
MRKVYDRLFVGSIGDCSDQKEGWATVHACKSPCHQKAVGYQGRLPSSHPHYLVYERPDNLYLNMIDPTGPLFMPPLFTEFLRFGWQQWEAGKNLLIHCNRGDSRAPSQALLFLSKVVRVLPAEGYWEAVEKFINLYPNYLPGQGIQIYLGKNWGRF